MDANGFFFCYDRKQRNPTMFQYIHAEVYARKACTNPKNKTKYCIDDIIGEVIRVLAMSARRSNVKVEPPCVARSARTPGSIVTSSTTNDSKESAPSPMLRMGSMHENEGTPTSSAVHAFGNEQPTGCDHAPAMGCKAKRAAWGVQGKPPASWSRAQRLAADILKRIIKA